MENENPEVLEMERDKREKEHITMNVLVNKLANTLLDDDYGINEGAFDLLCKLVDTYGNPEILRGVMATDGRFYLPE